MLSERVSKRKVIFNAAVVVYYCIEQEFTSTNDWVEIDAHILFPIAKLFENEPAGLREPELQLAAVIDFKHSKQVHTKILRFDLEQFLSFQTAKQLKKHHHHLKLLPSSQSGSGKKVNPGSLLVTFQSQWRRIYWSVCRSVGRLVELQHFKLSAVLPFYERNVVLECRRNANNSSSLKLDLLVNNFFVNHVDVTEEINRLTSVGH
ncbi:hypothetical protein T06_16030 [Trichinella sp. T6]|nr:hypothetical protein T06_16030 [Trichinella sp. T6]